MDYPTVRQKCKIKAGTYFHGTFFTFLGQPFLEQISIKWCTSSTELEMRLAINHSSPHVSTDNPLFTLKESQISDSGAALWTLHLKRPFTEPTACEKYVVTTVPRLRQTIVL